MRYAPPPHWAPRAWTASCYTKGGAALRRLGVSQHTHQSCGGLSQMRLFHKRAAKMHKAVLSPVNIQWTRQFLTFRRVIRAQDIVCIDEAGSEQFLARVCTAPRLPPRPCWRPRVCRVAFTRKPLIYNDCGARGADLRACQGGAARGAPAASLGAGATNHVPERVRQQRGVARRVRGDCWRSNCHRLDGGTVATVRGRFIPAPWTHFAAAAVQDWGQRTEMVV